MVFDIGNGLSNMGTAVSKTAGDYLLESQKADAEMEKVKLADQLAGVRQDKQNVFAASESGLGRTHAETLADKRLQGDKDVAEIHGKYSTQAAAIGAGGSIAAARIHADSVEKQLAQNLPLIEAQIESSKANTEGERQRIIGLTIANTSAQNLADAKKDLESAGDDPVKIAAAKARLNAAEYSNKDEVQRVSVLQTQARLDETALAAAQTRLVQVQDPTKTMTEEGKAVAAQLQRQVTELQARFSASSRAAAEASKNLFNQAGAPAGSPPPLSSFIVKPPPVTGIVNQAPVSP